MTMCLKNTAERFGGLTKVLHWLIAMLFVAEFFLVYRREQFSDDMPEKLQYILIHKSFGVTIFILGALMILWRFVGTHPLPPLNMSSREILASKIVHFLLYLSMLAQPLSGFLMSSYAGYGVMFYGYQIPNLFTKNESLSHLFFSVHQISSYGIIFLVGVHTFAALYHHFVRKDNVLKRMV